MCEKVMYNDFFFQGIDDDEDATDDLRRHAVISYVELLEKPNLPDILIQLICWVLGEYIYCIQSDEIESVLMKFIKLIEKNFQGMICYNTDHSV